MLFVLVSLPAYGVDTAPVQCPEGPPAERVAKYPELGKETRFPGPQVALTASSESGFSQGAVVSKALYRASADPFTLEASKPPRAHATGIIGEKRLKEQLREGWGSAESERKVQEIVKRLIPDGKEGCSRQKYDDFITEMMDATAKDDQLFWSYFSDPAEVRRARDMDGWEALKYDSLVAKCAALLRGCFEPLTKAQAAALHNLDRALGALVVDSTPPQCTALRISEHYAVTARHCIFHPETGQLRSNLRAGTFLFRTLGGRSFEVCSVVDLANSKFDSPGSKDFVALRMAPDPGGAADVVPAPMGPAVALDQTRALAAGAPLQMLTAYSFFPGADKHLNVSGASAFVRSKPNTCLLVAASGGVAYSGCNSTFRASGGPVFAVSSSTSGPMALLGIHGGTFDHRPKFERIVSETRFPLNAAAIIGGDFLRQFTP